MNREEIEKILKYSVNIEESENHTSYFISNINEVVEELMQLQQKTITEEEIEEAVKKREEEIRQWLIDEDYELLAEKL